MAIKATHNGTCQLCGALQAAGAGNRLAKHGYTVRWNFFEGVCQGAGHLPFELSIDLIEGAISRAQVSAATLRAQAAGERLKLDGNRTMVHVHLPATWKDRTSRRRWQEVEVVRTVKNVEGWEGKTHEVVYLTVTVDTRDQNGNEVKKVVNIYEPTLEEAVRTGRAGYALYLEQQAAQLEAYALWQQERVAGWKVSELPIRK